MKIQIIVTTIMMKYNYIKKIVTGAPNDTQHQNNAHPKSSLIDGDGVLLTNAQCHLVPISILWYWECWTIHLKCAFDTKQETITVSYHPTHQHGHNLWYVSLLKDPFLITKIVAIMYDMYITTGVYGPEPRSSGGSTSSNPQVSALIRRPALNGMQRMCQRHGSK